MIKGKFANGHKVVFRVSAVGNLIRGGSTITVATIVGQASAVIINALKVVVEANGIVTLPKTAIVVADTTQTAMSLAATMIALKLLVVSSRINRKASTWEVDRLKVPLLCFSLPEMLN